MSKLQRVARLSQVAVPQLLARCGLQLPGSLSHAGSCRLMTQTDTPGMPPPWSDTQPCLLLWAHQPRSAGRCSRCCPGRLRGSARPAAALRPRPGPSRSGRPPSPAAGCGRCPGPCSAGTCARPPPSSWPQTWHHSGLRAWQRVGGGVSMLETPKSRVQPQAMASAGACAGTHGPGVRRPGTTRGF